MSQKMTYQVILEIKKSDIEYVQPKAMEKNPEILALSYPQFLEVFLQRESLHKLPEHAYLKNNSFVYENLVITDDCLFDFTYNIRDSSVEFRNIIFKKVTFQNIEINQPVKFSYCKFGEAVFNNCAIKEQVFSSCLFDSALTCIGITKGIGKIFIEKCTGKELIIKEVQNSFHLSIQKSCFIENINILQCTASTVDIESCTSRNIRMTKNLRAIFIMNVRADNLLIFTNSNIINILSGYFRREMKFMNGKIENLKLQDIHGSSELRITSPGFDTLSIDDSEFEELCFNNSSFSNQMDFSNIKLKSLAFHRAIIRGDKIKFDQIVTSSEGMLAITNSDLGKASFIKCDFGSSICLFQNSKVNEIFLAQSDFPTRIYASDSDISNSLQNYDQAQLFYGQLQTAYLKQGDNIRANDSQSLETEAYYKSLSWKGKALQGWLKLPNFTKLSLGLNFVSNDFGRSWERGVVFSFGTGVVFFLFLVWSTAQYKLGLSWDSGMFGSFLRFMNPLRQFNLKEIFDIPKLTLNTWSHLWDFLGRVFVAYGYYQTIQAFRRYGKR